jgi:hypothetical protein
MISIIAVHRAVTQSWAKARAKAVTGVLGTRWPGAAHAPNPSVSRSGSSG